MLHLNRIADKMRYLSCWCVVTLLHPLYSSPRLLASLSKSPPSTRDNTWGYPEPSCDQAHEWPILEQVDGLGNFTRLQISYDVYRGSNWIRFIGRHGIDPQNRNITSPASEEIRWHLCLELCQTVIFCDGISTGIMTSSNGNIFRVTGHLCGEFTGPRWIPRTKASDAELWRFLWCTSE